MKIETNNLMTIANYANKAGFTTSYIYKMIREKKIKEVIIDGVKFIDKSKLSQ